MQDYLFISFFLGHDSGAAAKRLLEECDLLDHALAARANRHAWLEEVHTGVRVRLPTNDERLQRLLNRLAERGVTPFTRIDREYSDSELNEAEWLTLRVATAGLNGGIDYGQVYAFTNACPTCGAGSAPVPPLLAELGSMGKKDVDHLVYEGHLIVSSRVAAAVSDMTGVELAPVQSPRKAPDPRFAWLKITSGLPRMHSGYKRYDVCESCGRAGHYSNSPSPDAPTYSVLSDELPDFNLTWEYFGDWRQQRHKGQTRPVGGGAGLVVSQRVRQRLLALRVRRLLWIPVTVLQHPSPNLAPPNRRLQPTAASAIMSRRG
jgi:hypothetical protein